MVHDFAEVVFWPEDVSKISRGGSCLLVLTRLQPAIDLPARTTGSTDQPRSVPIEQLSIEAWLVVLPFKAGQRRQAEKIVHAEGGFRPHRHVGIAVFASASARILGCSFVETPGEVERFAFGSTLGRVVPLEADDRLESGAPGLCKEVVRAEEVSVVGHCDGRHAETTGLSH